MGQYQSSYSAVDSSNESGCTDRPNQSLGPIETTLNNVIFMPPNREMFKQYNNAPNWMRFIKTNSGKKISYFVIEPDNFHNGEDKKYIIWSHGNGSDIIGMYGPMVTLHRQLRGKVGIIAYDYEGYGFSNGICSEKNCYSDLRVIVKHALNIVGVKKENIFLIGQSLGTGVVVDFCAVNDWTTPIILLAPYKSIARVKVDPYWLDIVSNLFVNCVDMFCSQYKLPDVDAPIIIYHGMKDKLILPYHSVEMYNQHRDKITLILLKNAGHNDILRNINTDQILDIVFNYNQKNTVKN